VAVKSRGFDVLCHLASSLRLIWCSCSSARSFASVRGSYPAAHPPDRASRLGPCLSL